MSELHIGEDSLFLACPKCGGLFLHQINVDVFVRDREDADLGLHVHVDGNAAGYGINQRAPDVAVSRRMDNNPSERRQAAVIRFTCENCSWLSDLQIIQRKGQTLIEMVAVDLDGESLPGYRPPPSGGG